MPRKTSFCNGTLLRSDLRHYWPAGFLYVLVWLVLLLDLQVDLLLVDLQVDFQVL